MFSRRRWSLSSSSRHSESSKHHKEKDRDSRRHHSKQRRSSSERKTMELLDLDYTLSGRQMSQVRVKETQQLRHVAEYLRNKFQSGDQRITKDAQVQFFWDGKRLDGDGIPKGATTLRYRVLSAGDDGLLRVIWNGTTLKLSKAQLDTITKEISIGRSVGGIRGVITSLLRESNKFTKNSLLTPNQIVIEAAGGLRPGPLQGNSWELRKVEKWLCRYLTIDMKQRTNFLVLRGFNQDYIYHTPFVTSRGHIDIGVLKQWLKQSLLTSVHERGLHHRSRSFVDVGDIKLTFRGKLVRTHSHVRPGDTVDFDVPRVVEDKFVEAESWLLPLSEICIVCNDGKRISELPNRRRITSSCEHETSMCKACVGQWIASSMETVTWDRLKCPECPQLFQSQDVRALATKDVFDRYDMLATKAFLAAIPEFMWCLHPKCGSGQIHPAGCSKAKCNACKHSLCVRHHVPWHTGETCDDYERRAKKQRKNDKASEKHVKEITKPCPGCKRNVHKFTGCDHITCICGHEWCWLCFGTYYRDDNEFLQCRHTDECRYFADPPNYEGGRAFMPFMNGALPPQAPRPRPFAPRPPAPRPPSPVGPGVGLPPAAIEPHPRPPLHPAPNGALNVNARRRIERDLFRVDPFFLGVRDPPPRDNQERFVEDVRLFNLWQFTRRGGGLG